MPTDEERHARLRERAHVWLSQVGNPAVLGESLTDLLLAVEDEAIVRCLEAARAEHRRADDLCIAVDPERLYAAIQSRGAGR